MKKLISVVTILSLLINFAMIYFFFIRGNTAKIEGYRTAVVVSPENKEFILEEMRFFLEDIQLITQGLMKNDPSLIIQAGERSGTGPEHKAPKGLIESLPLNFKKMAFPTHDLFTEIKDSATVNFNPETTQRQLDKLLGKCITCHKVYRLATPLQIENNQ